MDMGHEVAIVLKLVRHNANVSSSQPCLVGRSACMKACRMLVIIN